MFDSRKPNSNYTTPITSSDTLLKHVLETHGHIYINNKNIAYNNKSLTYKSLKELAIIDEAFHDTFLAKYGLTFTSFYFMALNFNEKLNQNDITYIADDDYTEMTKDELASESKKLIRELVSNIDTLHNLDSKLEVNIYDTFIADNYRYFRAFAKVLSKYDNLVRAILANSDISLEVKDEEMPPVDEENAPIGDTSIENSSEIEEEDEENGLETEIEDDEDTPIDDDTPIENSPEIETEDEENDSMDPATIPQPGQEQEDTPTVLPEVDDSISADTVTEDEISLLKEACKLHGRTHKTGNITLDICLDADRLDLPRMGIIPTPEQMATEKGAELVVNMKNYYRFNQSTSKLPIK